MLLFFPMGMSSRLLPVEVFQGYLTGRKPQSKTRTRWRDYMSQLAWECLRILKKELGDVARKWMSEPTATNLDHKKWQKTMQRKDSWMD